MQVPRKNAEFCHNKINYGLSAIFKGIEKSVPFSYECVDICNNKRGMRPYEAVVLLGKQLS